MSVREEREREAWGGKTSQQQARCECVRACVRAGGCGCGYQCGKWGKGWGYLGELNLGGF